MLTFIAVTGAQSFGEAARRLGVSRPSLSRNMREMEAALGYVLFERSAHGVSLSQGGRDFLDKSQRLVAAHAQVRAAMSAWRAARHGRVDLVGTPSVLPVILPVLLNNLRREFGRAAMEVKSAPGAEVRRRVLDGDSAIGLCFDSERHPALRYTPTMSAQLGILASRELALPPDIRSLDDLADVSLVRLGDHSPVCELLRQYGVSFDIYFASPLKVDSMLDALELAHCGQAGVICSGFGASHKRAAGLRFVPLPGLLPAIQLSIVTRRRDGFDAVQERLRALLQECIEQADWHPAVHRARGRGATRGTVASARPGVSGECGAMHA